MKDSSSTENLTGLESSVMQHSPSKDTSIREWRKDKPSLLTKLEKNIMEFSAKISSVREFSTSKTKMSFRAQSEKGNGTEKAHTDTHQETTTQGVSREGKDMDSAR